MSEQIINDYSDETLFFNWISANDVFQIYQVLNDTSRSLPIWEYRHKEQNNNTILHEAITNNGEKLIEDFLIYLEKNKQDTKSFVNISNKSGVTAIHLASFKGDLKVIKKLVEFGADAKAKTLKKLDVIHFAAQGNQPGSILYFVRKFGISFMERDIDGSTPLHWAAYSGGDSAVNYLLTFGAEINAQNNKGLTPLHLAVVKNKLRIIKKLLQRGADLKILDYENHSAKNLADIKGLYPISIFLVKASKCQFCNFKAPIKPIKHKRVNIYILLGILAINFWFCTFEMFPILDKEITECLVFDTMIVTYILLIFLFFILYIYLMFSNASQFSKVYQRDLSKVVEDNESEVEENYADICPKCEILQADGTKHCSICDRCINGFDHHCYWVNNCIGKANYKFFFIFLVLAFILQVFIFSALIFTLLNVLSDKKAITTCYYPKILSYFSLIKEKKSEIISLSISIVFVMIIIAPTLMLLKYHIKNYERKKKNQYRRISKSTTYDESLLTIVPDTLI